MARARRITLATASGVVDGRIGPEFELARERPRRAALPHQGMEAAQAPRVALERLHIDRLAGAGGLGDHVDRILGHHHGVGRGEKSVIGIVAGPVPDAVGDVARWRPQGPRSIRAQCAATA